MQKQHQNFQCPPCRDRRQQYTINVEESEQRKNIPVVYLAVRPEERNLVDISTQPTVTDNIFIQDSYFVATGNMVINSQSCDGMFASDQTSHPDLDETLSFDPNRGTAITIPKSVRVQLFPSHLQLPSTGVEHDLQKCLT